MKHPVLGFDGKLKKQIELPSEVFDVPFKAEVLHRAIIYQRAKKQTGQHQTKTIGYVSGGGRKPHRQKGTGRARQGSSRSGHMRGGACTFGPQVRSHAIEIPKKILLSSVKMALSQRLREKRLLVVEDNLIKEIKTKKGVQLLKNLKVDGHVLLILGLDSIAMRKSLRNVRDVALLPPIAVNAYDIVKSPFLIITENALGLVSSKLHQKDLPKTQKPDVKSSPKKKPTASVKKSDSKKVENEVEQ